jgi:hypothetical protein
VHEAGLLPVSLEKNEFYLLQLLFSFYARTVFLLRFAFKNANLQLLYAAVHSVYHEFLENS